MFIAKGVGKYQITSSGNVETNAGGRYKLPIQRWYLGSNISGGLTFPNSDNHKNIELDVDSYFIEADNAAHAITHANSNNISLVVRGSGNISAGSLDSNGDPTATSVSRSYSYDTFGSRQNTSDTGILPSITNATKATNAVFTFSSDVTAGSGTNGVLSTTAPNNVFRIAFHEDQDDQGDWMRTLFTVTSISANGLTVTTSNNTTSFSTWSGTQSRVGGISLDEDNDRILRGTYVSAQSTNSTNSQGEYHSGEVTINDQTISGGPGGGDVNTEQVLGSNWHVVTLRPGRWYRFLAYCSIRDGSTGTKWQISGVPSTMTKSWGSSENSPNITTDGSSLGFYGYVTENTVITISGESQNNLRASMTGGGGPKTPFLGNFTSLSNQSGTVVYKATVDGNPYAPDFFAFTGAGVTKNSDGTVTAGIDLTNHTGKYSRTGFV